MNIQKYEKELTKNKEKYLEHFEAIKEQREEATIPVKEDLSNIIQVEGLILHYRQIFTDLLYKAIIRSHEIKKEMEHKRYERLKYVRYNLEEDIRVRDDEVNSWLKADYEYCLMEDRHAKISALINFIDHSKKIIDERTYEFDRIRKVQEWKISQ